MGLGYDFSREEFGFMPYASVVRATYRRDNSAEPLKRNFHILAAVAQIRIFRILKSDLILKNIQDISLVFRNFVFTFVYFQFCPKQKSGRWFLSTKF